MITYCNLVPKEISFRDFLGKVFAEEKNQNEVFYIKNDSFSKTLSVEDEAFFAHILRVGDESKPGEWLGLILLSDEKNSVLCCGKEVPYHLESCGTVTAVPMGGVVIFLVWVEGAVVKEIGIKDHRSNDKLKVFLNPFHRIEAPPFP